jgi:uncharacterized membrane protein
MPLARALARIETSLPPQDAAAFLSAMRLNAPRYLDAAQRLREARREVGRQIAAEPFDEAAVKQALVAWQAAWNGFIDDFSGPLVDALAQISTEGRRKLIAERRAAGSGVP